LIFTAAMHDIESERFRVVINSIPPEERLYTWRIANADADLGGGVSPALKPDEQALAHATLLNKFLLAADRQGCLPIAGKPYIHGLISEKYLLATGGGSPSRSREMRLAPMATRIVAAIVPDEELAKRTDEDIIHYKEKNRKLFEQFSYSIQSMVKQIGSVPPSPDFEKDVQQLLRTEVWRDQVGAETELRAAWENFFKTALKSAVAGAVAVGITPLLSLGQVTFGALLTGAAAAAPWAVSEALKFLEARGKARQHGLYYLLRFRS
jgi:hypothetical protein